MRHSLAHILASAIYNIYPNAQFGVGPVIENGFYYDILIDNYLISEKDFGKIEDEMRRIIKQNQKFENYKLPIEDALDWSIKSKQTFKRELIESLKENGTTVYKDLKDNLNIPKENNIKEVSFYKNGNFNDLCRGPHLNSTGEVGSFKLTKISGVYWRGDNNNSQMQRIYGVGFFTDKELNDYILGLEKAKNSDHRKLGKDLDLFVFSDLVGSGLPLFTPRGTIIRDELLNYSNALRLSRGFKKVFIPHLTKTDLYDVSGHMSKFGHELFLVKSQETKDKLVLKPMNCPHHAQIYSSQQRSYKELPIRYLETTTVYRDEKSGELGGLNRVRSITQDDSHIFCTEDQIEGEINQIIEMVKELYKKLNINLKIRLSFRDNIGKYLGGKEVWNNSQQQLKNALIKNDIEFYIEEGEAAFYGPKIDFMGTDSLDREHQIATVQLDFIQPKRFNLEYDDSNGEKKNPVMIHSALLGSVERLMSIIIEHTGGKLPVWLSPEQLRIVTINQDKEIIEYTNDITKKCLEMGIRIETDMNNESISKKIRKAELIKVPYVVVIGLEELKSNKVKPRIRLDLEPKDYKSKPIEINKFLEIIIKEVKEKSSKSLL